MQTTTCVGVSILTTLTATYLVTAAFASNVSLAGSWDSFLLVASNGHTIAPAVNKRAPVRDHGR